MSGSWTILRTMRGYAYPAWEPRVPRILDETLHCVVYLYRSQPEAEEAINIGGSAFLLTVPATRLPKPHSFVYVVTNRHLIEKRCLSVRINTTDGRFDVINTRKSDWVISDTDDIAICMIPYFSPSTHLVRTIPRSMLVTERFIRDENVGPGDEIILIGRFINMEGKERSLPTARFGHISQMPFEPIEYEGTMQDSFLCEVKSIGGFSGSPVILAPITEIGRPDNSLLKDEARLLGVDWAHIQSYECAIDQRGFPLEHIRYTTNTGMMAVVPAWKLDSLIDSSAAKERRDLEEKKEIDRRGASVVRTDFLAPHGNPFHKEDFTSLLDAAAKTRPQGAQTSPDENGESSGGN